MKRNWMFSMLVVATLPLAACTVEKTEEGEAPDVDVEVDAGKLPEYDVNAPKVEVKADTTMVVTPDVDIKKAKPTSTRD